MAFSKFNFLHPIKIQRLHSITIFKNFQKQKDNSNAMGYLLSYAIFAMNIMTIWR
nr:MAG TPA: hypothetical protein [Bacteriophage sp.]